MVEAIYVNGIFASVLKEILVSQERRPGETFFLQPYESRYYAELRKSPPSPEQPIRFYASTSDDLNNVHFVADLVGWEDKTALSAGRRREVEEFLARYQEDEGGLYVKGREDSSGEAVNLLSIRNLHELSAPFNISELIKESDSVPLKPRTRSGGLSYVRRRASTPFVTEADVGDAAGSLTESGQFDPNDIDDARERVATSIARRRGQPEFRRKLMVAYQERCAITGFDAKQALEAAHIHPYRGEQTNHLQNGLLLRADIHSLFDLGLVGIDPGTREVIVREELQNTQYAQLAGKKVYMPEDPDDRPSSELLQMHLQHARDNSW